MVKIVIGWPDQQLWPNRPSHWTARSRRRKEQKLEAWALALAERRPAIGDGPIPVRLTFRKADRRRFDLDNAQAACKGALDGLAAALGVDDSRFRPVPVLGEPVPGGAVEIEVGA